MENQEEFMADVDFEGIVDAVRVVAHFNEPMEELVEALEQQAGTIPDQRGTVADAIGNGASLFEALTKSAPLLANALHDFVYMVVAPHDSITRKDIILENVIAAVVAL